MNRSSPDKHRKNERNQSNDRFFALYHIILRIRTLLSVRNQVEKIHRCEDMHNDKDNI